MAAGTEVVEGDGLVVDTAAEAEYLAEAAGARGFRHTVRGAGATMTWLRLSVGDGCATLSRLEAHAGVSASVLFRLQHGHDNDESTAISRIALTVRLEAISIRPSSWSTVTLSSGCCSSHVPTSQKG